MRTLLPLHLSDNSSGMEFHHMPIMEASTPDRPEFSEAECDIDTLKKLKLGMRSSLWSRPKPNNANSGGSNQPNTPASSHPSDYSIAV